MKKLDVGQELPEFQEKEGFHTRFQQIDDATIQEKVESGHIRIFHKNKDGVWEAESPEGKLTLDVVGKNLFNVQLRYSNGSLETILYSPARKMRKFFVPNERGSLCMVESMEEDSKGWRDHRFFDIEGNLIEQKISENWALKKFVSKGEVLFDETKGNSDKLREFMRSKAARNR